MAIGAVILLAALALAMLTTGDGGEGDGDNDGGGDGGTTLTPELQKLLDAEKARLRKKSDSELTAAREKLREELTKESEEAARKAGLDEVSRIREEKTAADARAHAAEQRAQELEAQGQRQAFILQHAGEMDRAHRLLLDTELQAADPAEWESKLKEIQAEFEQSRRGRSLGTNSRPPERNAPGGGRLNDILRRHHRGG